MESKKKSTKKSTKSEAQETVRQQKIILMTIIVFLLCITFFSMGYAIGSVGTAGEIRNAIVSND